MTNKELFVILEKLPLAADDRGKLYLYLTTTGEGIREIVTEIVSLIPSDASLSNPLVTESGLESVAKEATNDEVEALLDA